MNDATLRLNVIAQAAALDPWIAKVREAKNEVRGLADAAGAVPGGPGAAPGVTGGTSAPGGTPPPAPPSAAGGPGTAGGGAPPPAPAPAVPGAPGGRPGTPGGPGGPPPRPAPANTGGGPGSWTPAGGYSNAPTVASVPGDSQEGGPHETPTQNAARGVGGKAVGFMGNALSTAVGVALGGSMVGYALRSAEVYMDLSRVIGQLGQRFRESGKAAAYFGGQLGYTIHQTAQLSTAYGEELNSFDEKRAGSMVGFARFGGQDAGQTTGALARFERLRSPELRNLGGRINVSTTTEDQRLAKLMGSAMSMAMDKGRFGEFLGTATRVQEMLIGRGAAAKDTNVLGLMELGQKMFGKNDPRGTGSMFMGTLAGMDALGQDRGVQTMLLREMRMGLPGGLSRREAMVQAEKGILDPGNLRLMLKDFDRAGIGSNQNAMFNSLAGKGLDASGTSALAGLLADPGRRADFLESLDPNSKVREGKFFATLTKDERALYKSKGMLGLGESTVTIGEGMAVKTEAGQMAVGAIVAPLLDGLQTVLVNTIKMTGLSLGEDFPTVIRNGVKAMTDLSGALLELVRVYKGEGYLNASQTLRGNVGAAQQAYAAGSDLGLAAPLVGIANAPGLVGVGNYVSPPGWIILAARAAAQEVLREGGAGQYINSEAGAQP